MHLQIHYAVFQPSQIALASWQFGKSHLEKKQLECHHDMTNVVHYDVTSYSINDVTYMETGFCKKHYSMNKRSLYSKP